MSNNIDKLADSLYKSLAEKDKRKPKGYDTPAEVTRISDDGKTVWVHIENGVDETPVQKTNNARIGDTVMVRVANGRAWLLGNRTNPATDDMVALQAKSAAESAMNSAEVAHKAADSAVADAAIAKEAADTATAAVEALSGRVDAAEESITEIETDISNLSGRVDTAETNITNIEGDITTLQGDVSTAQTNITNIQGDISGLQTRVSTAEGDISAVESDIDVLEGRVDDAQDDINDTLAGLSLAQNIIGTLAWITSHSKITEDTTPIAGKSYYIRKQDGTYELVSDTTGKNPAQEGWYEMDEAMSNYVTTHLAQTDDGLLVVNVANGWRVLVSSGSSRYDPGVYILDPSGRIAQSTKADGITFDEDRRFRIGDDDAFIEFDGNGHIYIGGIGITLGGSKTLTQLISDSNNTLIYDHTYEYVRDSNNKPVSANFTAFLYRGGVDVKAEYSPSNFTWYLKKEEKGTGEVTETLIGTGYTCSVNLADCGYGAEVVGKFSVQDNAEALATDGDNLTNAENENLSVRATGDSVRVRDLTVSSTIFPTDKIMVVGAEDEHLVTVQTLQDYLNANLNKQILFNTTAAWDAQGLLVSEPNTLYIYTDHQYDSQGNKVAGIKVGDGNAYLIDLPFTDTAIMEHINDNVVHITAEERAFWNNKVSCYLADGDRVIFTTA